jgi:hypothetical protein
MAVFSGIVRSVVLLGCATVAQAQSPEFGPLRFGMTLDEVRTATPDLKWTDVPARGGRAVDEIVAADAVMFAGMRFDAKVYVGAGNTYRMEFTREEQVPNAAACEAKGIALVADLEAQLGTFGWPVELITGEVLIQVGTGSSAMVSGWTDRFQHVARNRFAAATTTGFGMRARSARGEGPERIDINMRADLDEGTCRQQLVLRRGTLY